MPEQKTPQDKRQKRPDEAYEIEALSKGIKVLEALEDSLENPVTVMRVMERTGFSRDYCDRALKTWSLHGWVKKTERGWMLSSKFLRLTNSLEFIAETMI